MIKLSRFAATGVLLFALVLVQAQSTRVSKEEMKRLFTEGDYTTLSPFLEHALKQYPRDPDYQFFYGGMLTQTGTNPSKAIEVLQDIASSYSSPLVWFFLGKAHLEKYQYEEALAAFDKFNYIGSRDDKDKYLFPLYRTMCYNAQTNCSRATPVTVLKIDTIEESGMLNYLNKQDIHGRFDYIEEPSLFSNKMKKGLRFLPDNTDGSFQCKYAFGKKTRDLFHEERSEIGSGKPKAMGASINTAYDEGFVYYDASTQSVYFASQGHESSGGFDIFRSDYDKPSHTWSKPRSLGFPINTPFDEVAYVTLAEANCGILLSKRYCKPGKLVAYTLQYDNSTELEINADIALASTQLKKGKNISGKLSNTPALATEKNKRGNGANAYPKVLENEQNYQLLIRDALSLQIRTDSLKRVSDEKREKLLSARSEPEKAKLWQEIKSLDSRADATQQKADELYAKARSIELSKETKPDKVNPQHLAQQAFKNKGPANRDSAAPKQETYATGAVSYRIQIGVFSKPQTRESLKGLSPIITEPVNNGQATRYYVGYYTGIEAAQLGLNDVKEKGFKDAYIIGFYNGKPVPISRAKELEKYSQNR